MFLFISLMIAAILGGAEVDIFTPSFPNLQEHFNLSPFMVQLTLSINFIGYCFSCFFVGPLGDRFGRRPIILSFLMVFIIGSILCILSPVYWVLVLGRFFQGIGISGPTVLSYVVLMEQYPLEKQPSMMGVLNGIVASSMGLAPILGSYVNLYCGWQGNFAILLTLGLTAFVLCFFTIPKAQQNPNASLSIASYLPLLKSKEIMNYMMAICLVIVGYWVFIGISPILYMEEMGVPLEHFGYYQGIVAGAFALVSILSPIFLKRFGNQTCLKVTTIIATVSALALLFVGLFVKDNPLLITGLMVIYTAGLVFPFNVLYPSSLEVMPEHKGKTSALVMACRLIVNAAALQFLGYIYNGQFYQFGIFIGVITLISFFYIRALPDWQKQEQKGQKVVAA